MKLLILKSKCIISDSEKELLAGQIERDISSGVLVLDDSIDYEVVEFDYCVNLETIDREELDKAIFYKVLNNRQKGLLSTKG